MSLVKLVSKVEEDRRQSNLLDFITGHDPAYRARSVVLWKGKRADPATLGHSPNLDDSGGWRE